MPIEMPRGLPFAVDTWGPSSRRRRHRFLTHAHRDHLAGAGAAPDGGAVVYATRLTMSLALRHFPQLDQGEFVEVDVGKTLAVDDPAGAFSVTAYDANHCPGAVMFLFEGEFGSILHTGDCRLTPDCVQDLPMKYIAKKGKENICRLDFVFLDCTFSKCFLKLPSKESAIQQVIACIWKHPDAPFVYLACDLLGHEEILVEVSRTFGSKIYVDMRRSSDCYKALSLTTPDIITDDPSCRFQIVGFYQLYDSATKKLEGARANHQPEPLFIRPSTQWYACGRNQNPSLTEAVQDDFGIWHVCFSIHSSRDELEQALQLLQPQWVISTTPPCFAMELSYVKKRCFKTHLATDDPLWKIFRDPLQKSVSSPSSVLASSTQTDEDSSTSVDSDHPTLGSEECTHFDISTLELQFVPSPPVQEPDITLFGRARFCSQAIDIMKEDLCYQHIPAEETGLCTPVDSLEDYSEDFETYSGMDLISKQAPASQQDLVEAGHEVPSCNCEASLTLPEAFTVQPLPDVQSIALVVPHKPEKSETMVEPKSPSAAESSSPCRVRRAQTSDYQKDLSFVIGSSKSLNASLKRLYRSRNLPVPRPLPSLVGLLESSKRVKMRSSSDYSSLNSRHSLP
ncbi:5' exonuclease Apollo-like [Lolium rigidum]|uniref:5' exonuclease Apollo-like n=1 Tax=Lolium rigidum TaxID=89674 RepID=UPI001F5D7DD2|nr:5' exonuclease Apollo-like [Lolium rigidum]